MGCGASRRAVQPDPALTGAALRFGQQFEMTTPMLVMPFGVFKVQGRIMKSLKAWRDEGREDDGGEVDDREVQLRKE